MLVDELAAVFGDRAEEHEIRAFARALAKGIIEKAKRYERRMGLDRNETGLGPTRQADQAAPASAA